MKCTDSPAIALRTVFTEPVTRCQSEKNPNILSITCLGKLRFKNWESVCTSKYLNHRSLNSPVRFLLADEAVY